MDYLIPGCPYPISALALMFPPLSPARYARLLASIRAHGLRRPIVVWRGQVIDGLHRLKACLEAGVEPRYEFLDEGEDPFECLADENISLRNMTQNDKARLAYDMSQYSKPGRPRATDENSAHVRSLTQGEAAELVGVSKRLVSDASRVLSEDSTAVPALQEAVRERLVGCRDAAMVVDQPREVQIRGMELMAQTEVRTIKRAVERVEREIALAEEAAALADILARPPDETTTLHTATVADLHGLVTAGSVDAVISHPPLTEEALPLLSGLASFAAHALADTGVMVVVGNGLILPRMLERLAHPDLEWLAEFDLVLQGPPELSGGPHRIALHRRPLLVYGKEGFRVAGMDDLIEAPPADKISPGLRRNEVAIGMVLERFCRPGQTVCDPVMRDRAGTALAARRLGCTFFGASETQSSIDRIRVRLARAEDKRGDHLANDAGAEGQPVPSPSVEEMPRSG